MKKLLFTLFSFTFFLSGCTGGLQLVKQAEAYVKKHCPETKVTDPFSGKIMAHFECGELWSVEKLNNSCSQMSICLDIVNGRIWADVLCDSLINPHKVLQGARPDTK